MATGMIVRGTPCIATATGLHPIPRVHQPAAPWVAAVDDGVQPCQHCGAVFGCDCLDWPEWMAANVCPECGGTGCDCVTDAEMAAVMARIDADPHGVNDLDGLDIPY